MIADRTYEFERIDSKYVNEQTLQKNRDNGWINGRMNGEV